MLYSALSAIFLGTNLIISTYSTASPGRSKEHGLPTKMHMKDLADSHNLSSIILTSSIVFRHYKLCPVLYPGDDHIKTYIAVEISTRFFSQDHAQVIIRAKDAVN